MTKDVLEPEDAPERKGVRPARNAGPTLLELVQRVHAGTLTPEEAVQIFVRSRAPPPEGPSA